MKKQYYILLLLFFIVQSLYGQNISIDSLFSAFKKEVEIEQLNTGMVVMDDETRLAYYLLMLHAPIEKLEKFTNDENPAVRGEIFTGLVQKDVDSVVIDRILKLHENDTAEFTYCPTDVVISWRVNELMHASVRNKSTNPGSEIDYNKKIERLKNKLELVLPNYRHGLISRNDLLQLDSLIFSNKEFEVQSFMLVTNTQKNAKSKNNTITRKMKKIIADLNSGDRVYFEYLEVKGPDKTIRQMGTIMMRIK